MTAATVTAAKTNFFMGLLSASLAVLADELTLPRMNAPRSEALHTTCP
jgi:hypothetical protein